MSDHDPRNDLMSVAVVSRQFLLNLLAEIQRVESEEDGFSSTTLNDLRGMFTSIELQTGKEESGGFGDFGPKLRRRDLERVASQGVV